MQVAEFRSLRNVRLLKMRNLWEEQFGGRYIDRIEKKDDKEPS